MRVFRLGAVAIATLAIPLVAFAQWEEDFDSYTVGQGLARDIDNGWEFFCGGRKDCVISDVQRRSRSNSALCSFSDVVYSGIDLGRAKQFRISVWIYIPSLQNHSDMTITGYNVYDGDTCEVNRTVSAIFTFSGKVEDGLRRFNDVTFKTGSWRELRVDVDMGAGDLGSLAMYYDDQLVSEGDYLIFDGPLKFVALGFNTASDVYFDDISVTPPPLCQYEQTKVKRKKCKESRCPEVVPGCMTTNDKICGAVEDCKKKFSQKTKCNDPREKGKCKIFYAPCDCAP